jgi:hypothetical protein
MEERTMIIPIRDRLATGGGVSPVPATLPQPGAPGPTDRADEAALVRRARRGDSAAFVYPMMGDAGDTADRTHDCLAMADRALAGPADTRLSAGGRS